jgi:hypothetical protein
MLEQNVAQAAAGRPRRSQGRVELVWSDQARSRDHLAERQVAIMIFRSCH